MSVLGVVRIQKECGSMGVAMKPEIPLKAAVSVSWLCRQLSMSRSQFYFHVKRGTFHAPLRLASNQRPYYTASMVEDIVKARKPASV